MFAKLLLAFACLTTAFAIPPRIPEGEIVGGKDAVFKQFPHMAALYRVESDGTKNHYCGGSVISPDWVMTAAHCVGSSDINILLGATNIQDDESEQQTFTATSDMVIVHEEYTGSVVAGNDIALIKLSPPADFSSGFVGAVGLPRPIQDPAADTTVYPTGWGYTSDVNKSMGIDQDTLRFVDVQIISHEECSESWSPLKSMICTTAGAKNICNGDSGGPINNKEIMESGGLTYGITSYGRSSCQVNVPSVFTRVSSFLDWIQEKTGVTA